MFQGVFNFKYTYPDSNTTFDYGIGALPINIKTAQLATFANSDSKQQGYKVTEVNKLISTMLTGWGADGNKPKSMSDNYLELILSCDNGFVVKKRLQFPHIIAWKDDSTPYNIANIYKEFSIDNWLKADDFENPDITLVVEPTDEILTTSTTTPPEATTTNSGRFYLYYRNLPVGVNRIHIDFHIKTKTEPIDFDLEVIDGFSWKDAQIILASNEQAKINVLLGTVKDVYKFNGAEGDFEDITMHEWSALYQSTINLNPSNKFTHDLYFYIYDESEINTKITELESKTSLSVNDFLASGFISQTAAGIYYDPNYGVTSGLDNPHWNGFVVYLRPSIKSFLVKGGIYYAHYFNDYPNIKDKALGSATIASPNADGLVEISVSSNDNGCYILVTMNIDKQKVSDASVISTEMYLMKKSFIDAGITDMPLLKQSLNDKIGGYEEQINGRWNSRGAILIDGTIITDSRYDPWSYTDPIPVNRGDIIIVNCAGGVENISAIASSDANGESIKNIKSTIYNQVVYYFVNDEEYIRCTTRFSEGGYARIYKGGVISEEMVLLNKKHDSDIDKLKKIVIDESLTEVFILQAGQRLEEYLTINKLGKWKFKLDSDSTEITDYQIWARDSSDSNIGFITCNVGVEYEYDLPLGTAKVLFFRAVNVSTDTSFTLHYTIPSDLQAEFNEIHNSLNKSSKTDGIVERGSELTQDNVNLLSERSHKLNVTNTNVPVVAFIFDDNYVQSYVDLFNERGLKLTFAIIGNVNKSAWATTGNAIRKQVLNGHGTCAHGVVGGVSVTGSGVDTMNDADVKIATEGENKAFDDYKLSHRGLVQYNTWQDNPHTWALMGRYYDYIVGFDNEKCINAPSTTDLYRLRRMWTDNPNMLDAQKASVDAAIAQGDCLLIFGGHFARTGQGGTYSTMEEFVALLDYVAEKVSAGQMLSLNMDDAVDMLWGRAIAHNVVMASNYSYRNPMANSMKIENGLKICTNVGTKAIYSMRITGTTVAGAFTINLGNASKTTNVASCQSVTINTTAGESITFVISKIVSSIYKAYTVRSFNDGEVVLYRDINGVTFTPYITNNTSELVFDIVQITEGTEAVWE